MHLRRLHFDVDFSFLPSDPQGILQGDSLARAQALTAACTDTFDAFTAHAENTLRRARFCRCRTTGRPWANG